jgi:hypothetical protein
MSDVDFSSLSRNIAASFDNDTVSAKHTRFSFLQILHSNVC